MKHFFNRFQTTIKALQLLSEPEVMNKLFKTAEDSKSLSVSSGKLIYHKHFIVQVLN